VVGKVARFYQPISRIGRLPHSPFSFPFPSEGQEVRFFRALRLAEPDQPFRSSLPVPKDYFFPPSLKECKGRFPMVTGKSKTGSPIPSLLSPCCLFLFPFFSIGLSHPGFPRESQIRVEGALTFFPLPLGRRESGGIYSSPPPSPPPFYRTRE